METTPKPGIWQRLFGGGRTAQVDRVSLPDAPRPLPGTLVTLDLPPNDPLVAYFSTQPGVVEIDNLNLDSPSLRDLHKQGVKLVVPLVNQGELLGLLNLGNRLSDQDYSSDDRVLLNNLATQTAPAIRVAQLVRQQQLETQARERLEQELRIARLVQQTLLPKELPTLEGWHIAAHYRPARSVGGDFYDFVQYSDGRLGLVIGDVTDKGVPAALVMASTRATLRGVALDYNAAEQNTAEHATTPGDVLARANDLIVPDIPPKMFITCFYAILDPATGLLQYANAGHDVPYVRRGNASIELRARGMPLGLLPGMSYEVHELQLEPGDSILFYSDGLVEAHNAKREMFGFPRLSEYVAMHAGGRALIQSLLDDLVIFTGPDWEQEDDVTLMTLERSSSSGNPSAGAGSPDWKVLASFETPSEDGNERQIMKQVADAVQGILPASRMDQLKTAVAETAMNAIEHGNKSNPELNVQVLVKASPQLLSVHITDEGGSVPIPDNPAPDLDAKLAGMQSPRGWGLFLIKQFVDEMNIITDEKHHTVELVWHLEDASDGTSV
jgi:serine phosphatase RsbU (regulator of sigma subunit)/anti-sigma regulatory factor (Ser/Thr protein kinase)